MKVYVARQAFVAADFNARDQRVALASHWAVEKYPDNWRLIGTVDAITAARIKMLDDAAVLPVVLNNIMPITMEGTEKKGGPSPMTTEEEVERMRAELVAAGKPSGERSIAAALGVSRDAVRYAEGKDRH
jgi:hypothetical protein